MQEKTNYVFWELLQMHVIYWYNHIWFTKLGEYLQTNILSWQCNIYKPQTCVDTDIKLTTNSPYYIDVYYGYLTHLSTIKSNMSKLNRFGTNFCVPKRQVFDLYRFSYTVALFYDRFIQHSVLFRVRFRQVTLYFIDHVTMAISFIRKTEYLEKTCSWQFIT